MTNKSKEELKRYTNNEFILLLNEGADDESIMSFGEYVSSMEEADKDAIDHILTIGHFAINEAKQIGADFIKRIN